MHASITIDVESDWGGRSKQTNGVRECVPEILKTLDAAGVKATFFLSAAIIDETIDTLEEIKEKGHEIGSHGLKHDYKNLNKEQLKEDITKSKKTIEEKLGVKTTGFRAPQLRAPDGLFNVLSEAGFKYDSSMRKGFFPGRYSYNIEEKPFAVEGLTEIPVSNIPYLMLPLGLLWVNLIGFSAFKFFYSNSRMPESIVLYLHPFDLLKSKQEEWYGHATNAWYNLKSKKVVNTFNSVVDLLKKDREIITLEELWKTHR